MKFEKRLPEKIAVYPLGSAPQKRCEECEGYGTTGEMYSAKMSDHMLMVGVLCEECQGCGDATHGACSPEEHIRPDEFTGPDAGEGEWITEEMLSACAQCYGRKWEPVPAGGEGEDGPELMTMKVPCVCAGDIIRTIE